MKIKSTSVYFSEEDKKLIEMAAKILALPLATFLRTSGVERSREILLKNKGGFQ